MKRHASLLLVANLLLIHPAISAATVDNDIQAAEQRIEQINADFRTAQKAKDTASVDRLRQERKQVQAELHHLKQQQKQQSKSQKEQARLEQDEAKWAALPAPARLCKAIQQDRLDRVKKVLESGELTAKSGGENCEFPLGNAAALGRLAIVEYLLQQDFPTFAYLSDHRSKGFRTTVMDMTAGQSQDRTDSLALLKRLGVPLYEQGKGESVNTLMEYAATEEERQKLDKEQNINVVTYAMGSSLTKSLEKGHINNVRWLLNNGANPNDFSLGRTALMVAIHSFDMERVKLLVDSGANVNLRGIQFMSALSYAESLQNTHAQYKNNKADYFATLMVYLKLHGATYSKQEIEREQQQG